MPRGKPIQIPVGRLPGVGIAALVICPVRSGIEALVAQVGGFAPGQRAQRDYVGIIIHIFRRKAPGLEAELGYGGVAADGEIFRVPEADPAYF